MYLHIGKGICINEKDILAIFNIENIKNTKENEEFYQKLFEENNIINISEKSEKSLILIEKNNIIKAYISNINANTIGKRKI